MRQALALALGVWLIVGMASAGEFNKVLSVGDAAPTWEKLPDFDGQPHALTELREKEVVVIAFTCNSCPVAVDYEDRLVAFARQFAGPLGKVGLVAINANTVEADRPVHMKERAKEKGFTFPYLYDETGAVAKKYGASTTPEFFVLDRARHVVYLGAFDDKNQPGQAKQSFVADAVTAALAGQKPAVTETLPRGCAIRFARPKR